MQKAYPLIEINYIRLEHENQFQEPEACLAQCNLDKDYLRIEDTDDQQERKKQNFLSNN